jgi:hypothetical protein
MPLHADRRRIRSLAKLLGDDKENADASLL